MSNSAAVEAFLAKGGKIQQVREGERTLSSTERRTLDKGEDYTDTSMRRGELGLSKSGEDRDTVLGR